MSGQRCSRSPLTGDNISGSEFSPIFSFRLFSVTTFSHRMAPRIQKLILQKLTGAPKTQGLDPFSVGHFGGPWWPFWILKVVPPLPARFVKVYRSHKLCRNVHSHNSCGNASGKSPSCKGCGNAVCHFINQVQEYQNFAFI